MKKSFLPPFLIAFAAILSCCFWSEPVNAAVKPVKGHGSPLNQATTSITNPRNQIVCISDIHLGIDTTYAECKKNRQSLVKFLEHVRVNPGIKELVVAGDLLDEWYIPAEVETFKSKSQRDFVQTIADSNKTVIAAFRAIIKEGKVKVTYVPGNHDLLITADDVKSILPGITQARDVQGLGSYSPLGHSEIIIEHGHRYNFFCAPDPFSNQAIAPGSILPPGYFFTRIAAQSIKEQRPAPGGILPKITQGNPPLMYEYWQQWYNLMNQFPIKEGLNDKIIKTNIDGYKANYSINDLVPFQLKSGLIDVKLFKGIATEEIWAKRELHNKVAVKIPVMEAITKADSSDETDKQAITQYFTYQGSDKRIVIFGHTHEAKIIPGQNLKKEKTIYANSGTWIDKNKFPTRTFVVITPGKSGVNRESVDLYQYSESGERVLLAHDELTN